ncbi:MAG: UvrD-helicase domain-containing protein [Planctomycetales bacterium]|nr:UvrD-helicase domain-containing protein [Planctomycetales bacterium]
MSNPTDYTPQQAAGITARDVSIALDAGAGCGKTFVLTERYLSHLAHPSESAEPPLELHELVAITFTDAAAREMRERIRAKCLARMRESSGESAGYWYRVLREIDSARVSTIHAFCSTLVRGHALELGLDPNFHLLDQAAADVLLSEATDDYLRLQLEQRSADVMQLAAEFGVAGLKSRLTAMLDAVGAEVQTWLDKPPEEIVAAWRGCFAERIEPLQREQLASSPEIEIIRSMIPVCTGAADTQAKLARLDALLASVLAQEATPADIAETRALAKVQGVCGKKADWPDAAAKKRYGDACKKLRDQIDKLNAWTEHPDQLEAARMAQRLARVAAGVAAAYEARKADSAALDFNDLLTLAHRLLTDPEFRDAQRQARAGVRLLLVDEFQDTDQLQVDIVKTLVGDAVGQGGLFFVGDFKQSIYRFRGAMPEVFRRLQEEIPAEGQLPLSVNFRSQPAVLSFINGLFQPLFGRRYEPLHPSRPQLAPEPAAQFLWAAAPAGASAEAKRRCEARRIAQHIQQLLEDPTERIAEKKDSGWTARRVKRGDIAILFRALSDVQFYEEALRDAGIDHHLIGGHAFYSQQEVFDLLNLLRVVVSRCDEVSLAGVLRSPFFSLFDETLLWMVRSAGSLNAAIARKGAVEGLDSEQQRRVDHARSVIAELRATKGSATTAQVIRTALDRTAYDAALLAEFLGERKLANLEKIVEQARVADQTRPGDVDAFVRQLSEFIARQPKEALAATTGEEDDLVRLMTVHHSKGLEFPVVFVADLARESRSDGTLAALDPCLGPLVKPTDSADDALLGIDLYRAVQNQEEREESLRTFYVACTRAADLLVLSSAVEDFDKLKGQWLERLADVFNLQTGARIAQPAAELLVEVVHHSDAAPSGIEIAHGVNLPKLLDKADTRARPVSAPAEVASIAINPADLRRFSVSRLTGKLHYRREVAADSLLETDAKQSVDPIALGTLIHAVMERIDFAEPARLATWCEALAPQHERRRPELAAEEAARLIENFLQSDRCKELRTARSVKREVEFLFDFSRAGGLDAQLQGYIDCLYEDSEGHWRVLDYKSNVTTAAKAEKLAETYRLQMWVYALAVEQALGVQVESLELFFLRPGVEVSIAWNAEVKAQAAESIRRAIEEVRGAAGG